MGVRVILSPVSETSNSLAEIILPLLGLYKITRIWRVSFTIVLKNMADQSEKPYFFTETADISYHLTANMLPCSQYKLKMNQTYK